MQRSFTTKSIPICLLVAIASAGLVAQVAPGRIRINELRALHGAGKVLVVDVRSPDAFATGHIPGAINIPLGHEEQAAHASRLKAEKRPIVTYCA